MIVAEHRHPADSIARVVRRLATDVSDHFDTRPSWVPSGRDCAGTCRFGDGSEGMLEFVFTGSGDSRPGELWVNHLGHIDLEESVWKGLIGGGLLLLFACRMDSALLEVRNQTLPTVGIDPSHQAARMIGNLLYFTDEHPPPFLREIQAEVVSMSSLGTGRHGSLFRLADLPTPRFPAVQAAIRRRITELLTVGS